MKKCGIINQHVYDLSVIREEVAMRIGSEHGKRFLFCALISSSQIHDSLDILAKVASYLKQKVDILQCHSILC